MNCQFDISTIVSIASLIVAIIAIVLSFFQYKAPKKVAFNILETFNPKDGTLFFKLVNTTNNVAKNVRLSCLDKGVTFIDGNDEMVIPAISANQEIRVYLKREEPETTELFTYVRLGVKWCDDYCRRNKETLTIQVQERC